MGSLNQPVMKAIVNHGMERLVVAVQELSLARDLETVMRIVRDVARELTGADGATFILQENGMCFYADENAISPLWKGQRFPMGNCISGWAMLNKQPAIVRDIFSDSRIPVEAYEPTFVRSLTMVPIRTIDPIGAIGNYWAHHHTPTEEEVKLLQALADITAVAIENVNVRAELEQRVRDRTLELEIMNKELEAFSYSVSHDLRAPLRAIRVYLDILLEDHDGQLDDKGKQLTHKVSRKADEMGKLIEDLLAFFSMTKRELVKTNLSMKEMATSVCKELNELQTERSIECHIGNLPDTIADQALMRQVWRNLLSNAIKYTRLKEKATITVGFEQNVDSVTYYVKDNGAGFDMQYYDKLFNVFQRLHIQKEYEGSGIGLAIVERIVSRHGGKVWAEARPSEGATFYFSLPNSLK